MESFHNKLPHRVGRPSSITNIYTEGNNNRHIPLHKATERVVKALGNVNEQCIIYIHWDCREVERTRKNV